MIYFDNSATSGFKPDVVINAVTATLKYLSANPGRSGHSLALRAGLLVYNTRKKVADFIGQKNPERVVFCSGCTMALNMAIQGTVVLGGNVITTAYEHNSVLRPLFELERMGKISVTVLPPNELGHVTADKIMRAITPKTYMAVVNNVSNVTGAISPINEIGRLCRRANILLAVDGAQSVGYGRVLMDEQSIDLLALAPHKGLHAPQGIGVLAIGERVKIRPVFYGGTGTHSDSVYQPQELPESLESGTLSTPAIAGLNAAISYNILHHDKALEQLNELSVYALEKLNKIKGIQIFTPPNTYNGMISFNIGSYGSMDVCNILSSQYDIATRGGLHCAPLIHKHLGTLQQGIIRASLSYENTAAEVDDFIIAVSEIASH